MQFGVSSFLRSERYAICSRAAALDPDEIDGRDCRSRFHFHNRFSRGISRRARAMKCIFRLRNAAAPIDLPRKVDFVIWNRDRFGQVDSMVARTARGRERMSGQQSSERLLESHARTNDIIIG